MTFAVGSLVRARGREWVVLPESEDDLLVVRPLGGTDDEVAGIYLPLETVQSATFELPDPTRWGDHNSGKMLRDAVRLGFRSSAGPFRSFAKIAVEPRPYQLVPLLMALKLDPVRLLISDDVGIGKTVEAGLVARELLDRAEVHRLAVLCPPHLAEQWRTELLDKFNIQAELVLPSTAPGLERDLAIGQSLFDVHKFTVVSTDFIKMDKRRDDFVRACPELVIVDEAHTCSYSAERSSGRHQRHQLISRIAANPNRHLILVTATPHSGNEDAFRSLLAFLDPEFEDLPVDLGGAQNERHRRRLASHFVQRRRGDIRHYMQTDTPFPNREEKNEDYKLHEEYRRLFDKVLRYARETVLDSTLGTHRQRVRWWSALALLRSLASSPAAAAATLRNRAAPADTETVAEADEVGRRTVLDMMEDETSEGADLPPGSIVEQDEGSSERRRLLEMAREAEALQGAKDNKLQKALQIVSRLIADGFQPIVFCRFIPTAEYVKDALRSKLPKDVAVGAVTGLLPPAEREERVLQLAGSPRRVLVATDCLSEGVNLQEHFNAVLHYDLSWNPTRHEQREGRVDRYGQASPNVRVVTYFGTDNQIDGIVLNVLINKHKAIRTSLGISVPIPVNTEQVVEAIFEGLLLRERTGPVGSVQQYMPGFEEMLTPTTKDILEKWDQAEQREKRSRTVFAQETIKVDEVSRELEEARDAVGSGVDLARFLEEALGAHKAAVSKTRDGAIQAEIGEVPVALRDALGEFDRPTLKIRSELPVRDGEIYLTRTHPLVEGLAGYVMDTALDSEGDGVARRCGVISTSAVDVITTLLLLRFRYHIVSRPRGGEEHALLAEDCRVVGFADLPEDANWLSAEEVERLLLVQPDSNVAAGRARYFLKEIIVGFDAVRPRLNEIVQELGRELLDAHRRVRSAARMAVTSYEVVSQLPPDILGLYVFLPAGSQS